MQDDDASHSPLFSPPPSSLSLFSLVSILPPFSLSKLNSTSNTQRFSYAAAASLELSMRSVVPGQRAPVGGRTGLGRSTYIFMYLYKGSHSAVRTQAAMVCLPCLWQQVDRYEDRERFRVFEGQLEVINEFESN